jgi:hypothetical protein
MGGVRPNASENGQISPSTTVRAAQGDDGRPHLAAVLQEGRKTANIQASSGVIRGIPVQDILRLIAELRPPPRLRRRREAVDRAVFESKRLETCVLMTEKAEVCGTDCDKSATSAENDVSVPRVTHNRIVNVARWEHPDPQRACHLLVNVS